MGEKILWKDGRRVYYDRIWEMAIYLDGRGIYRVGEREKFLKMGDNDI